MEMLKSLGKQMDRREMAAAVGFLLIVSVCTAFAAAVNVECSRVEKLRR